MRITGALTVIEIVVMVIQQWQQLLGSHNNLYTVSHVQAKPCFCMT